MFFLCVYAVILLVPAESVSMILTVPIDVFAEFVNIYLYSHYTVYPLKMNRVLLFTGGLRKI